jgi:pimeloyl-ACP methyl ester carboxylesterase
MSADDLPFSDSMPAGEAPLRWARYISAMLHKGFYANDLAHQLATLEFGSPDALKNAVVNSIPLGYFPIFKQIDCTEIDEKRFNNLVLSSGDLIIADNLCGDLKFTTPYDSAKEKITVPIVYFTGTSDPVTPVYQARYHFDHHREAKRTLVTVPRGAHYPFGSTLGLCHKALWVSILLDQVDLKQALASCPGVKSVKATNVDAKGRLLDLIWQ